MPYIEQKFNPYGTNNWKMKIKNEIYIYKVVNCGLISKDITRYIYRWKMFRSYVEWTKTPQQEFGRA